MKYYKLFLFTFLFFRLNNVVAQLLPEQDCFNAIPVCAPIYNQAVSYSGNGETKDIPDNSSCLVNEENNSVWYIFTVTQSGVLEMDITPVQNDDYDFAIYNVTNASCADITQGTLQTVRCNYAARLGQTGMRIGQSLVTAGVADSNFLRPLDVLVGETYVLMVDNFNASGGGYTLDFTTSGPNPASIIDQEPPTMESLDPFGCDTARTLVLNYSENISCSSIDSTGGQFTFTGPATIGVVKAEGIGCNTGSFTNQVILTIAQPILLGGNYSLNLQAGSGGQTISDYCGNQAINNTLPLVVPTVAFADFDYSIAASCLTDTFYFNDISVSPAIAWTWNFGDGSPTSSLQNPVHVFPDTIPYTITLIISTGTCTDTVSKVIDVTRSFSADFSISNLNPCIGDTVFFADTSPGSAANYLWQFGDSNISGADSTFNTYGTSGSKTITLTIADGTGACTDSVSKTINVRPLPDANFTTNTDPICSGLPVRFNSTFNATADSTIWNFGNGNMFYDTTVTFTFPIGGTYDVQHTVIDLFCGTDDTTITFEVLQRPEFSIGNDTSICLSEEITISGPLGVDEYRWSTGETTQSIVFVEVPDEVAVTVTTNGCSNSDVIFVDERKEDCYYVKIPSAFSPNNDDLNDVLRIFLLRIKSFDLKIYNRWGELMFETNNANVLWDGFYKGDLQDMAVYQYYVDGVSISGDRFFRSGNVTLIR
jgi:gliding motility-associated-like protein